MPFAKLERAKHHLANLKTLVANYYASKPYTVLVTSHEGWLKFTAKENRTIPSSIALTAGDAIHNARSALDHMAAMFTALGGGNIDRAAFPIPKKGEGIVGVIADKTPQASPRARRFMQRLHPHKGGNARLWLLHSLDLSDKHRQIVPVGAAHASIAIAPKLGAAPNPVAQTMQFGNITGGFVLDGDVFFTIPEALYPYLDIRPTFDIRFGGLDGPQDREITLMISDLIEYVEKILNIARRKGLLI